MYSDIKPIVLPRDEYILERQYRATGQTPRRGYILKSVYRIFDGSRRITYLDKTQFLIGKNGAVIEVKKLSDEEFSKIMSQFGYKIGDALYFDEDDV